MSKNAAKKQDNVKSTIMLNGDEPKQRIRFPAYQIQRECKDDEKEKIQ